MIEIVINYDKGADEFKIYEPTSDTLLVSKNLTEALVNLNLFLVTSGMIQGDLLGCPDITYHLDSGTLINMVESNVTLLKRLKTAPSGFMISSQRFGGTSGAPKRQESSFKDSAGKGKSKFGQRKKGSSFSGKSGFNSSNKKFGGPG